MWGRREHTMPRAKGAEDDIEISLSGSGEKRCLPTWAMQCIYCIIQCIHSVSDSSPDTLRYNTYCIHCISTRYSGYGLYQPLDQIQWIRIAHVGLDCAWTRHGRWDPYIRTIRARAEREPIGFEPPFCVCFGRLFGRLLHHNDQCSPHPAVRLGQPCILC